MILKPYKNLNSEHLDTFLFIVRCLYIIGWGVLFFACYFFVLYFLSPYGMPHLKVGFVFFISSISLLLISGICAALIAFEENHRVSANRK